MVCSAKRYLVPPRTGNAIVVSTNESDIRGLFVTGVVWKLPKPRCVGKEWVTLSWRPRFLIFGISRGFRPEWDWCWICPPEIWRRYCTLLPMWFWMQVLPALSTRKCLASNSIGKQRMIRISPSEQPWGRRQYVNCWPTLIWKS